MEFLFADWLGLIAGGVGWSLWQTRGHAVRADRRGLAGAPRWRGD